MDILTTATQSYVTTFSGFVGQLLHWGQWLFFSLLTLNITWLAYCHAFDRGSLAESMPAFIKKFTVITIFYSIMINPAWLEQILATAKYMGAALTHYPIDPSSLISEGIGIANKIIVPVEKASLLTAGFGLIVIIIVYVIILFVFMSIALELAVTMIMTTALIAMATFFLGFSALGATQQIARQTLDVILGNCVKLLGIYLVVAAGGKTMFAITSTIPTHIVSFDPYAWIVATAVLFWLLAKNLPNQLGKIVTNAFQETHGTDAAALAMAAVAYAQTAMPAMKVAGGAAQGIAQIAGSTGNNAASHFSKANAATGSLAGATLAAIGGTMAHLGKAMTGQVSDHFKHIGNKLAGGSGLKKQMANGQEKPFDSIAARMHKSTQDVKASANAASHSAKSGLGQQSSTPTSDGQSSSMKGAASTTPPATGNATTTGTTGQMGGQSLSQNLGTQNPPSTRPPSGPTVGAPDGNSPTRPKF